MYFIHVSILHTTHLVLSSIKLFLHLDWTQYDIEEIVFVSINNLFSLFRSILTSYQTISIYFTKWDFSCNQTPDTISPLFIRSLHLKKEENDFNLEYYLIDKYEFNDETILIIN